MTTVSASSYRAARWKSIFQRYKMTRLDRPAEKSFISKDPFHFHTLINQAANILLAELFLTKT